MFRITLLLALTLVGCERNKPAPAPTTKPAPTAGPAMGEEVRARVNGVPITGLEVAQRLAGAALGPAGERATAAQQQTALDQAIVEELLAQRALELGLSVQEADAGAPSDPKARDARRHALAKKFRMSELLDKALVTPEEAHAWFDAHAARVQHELELQAVSLPSRAAAEAFVATLGSGKSFDEAAAAQFPEVTEPKPWAPASMSWSVIPPPWWTELDALEPGKSSGVITDQQGHYWVLKLLGRKPSPVTFEAAAPAIQATIQAQKFEERLQSTIKELRAKAKIELLSQ